MDYNDELSFAASAALSDPEFAQSLPELEALLFQDVEEPDFREGAEDLHSFALDGLNDGSTTFLDQDNNWLKSTSDFSKFNLADIFVSDAKLEQQNNVDPESLFPNLSSFDLAALQPADTSLNNYSEEISQQPSLIVKNEFSEEYSQPILFQEHTLEGFDNHSYAAEAVIASPSSSYDGQHTKTPHFINCEAIDDSEIIYEDQYMITEEIVSSEVIEAPAVDHVIVSESDLFNSELSDDSQAGTCSTPEHPVGGAQPQTIVINLKKVCLPSSSALPNKPISMSKLSPRAAPETTLVEVLNNDENDELLREFINPQVETSCSDEERIIIPVEHSLEDVLMHEIVIPPSSPTPSTSSQSSDGSQKAMSSHKESSSRYAPYSSMEKKLRKKEQNKRAALRYRQKKKEEEDDLLAMLNAEEEKKKAKLEQMNSLRLEAKFMLKMFRDFAAQKRKTQ